LNGQSDAPGADDDGSGVAAVLELARVMATHKFDATIKFVTFAGEEEGLFGSTKFANDAKTDGLNIAGMFSNDIIGSSLGQNGDRDTKDVRLFAEGPFANETASEATLRRTMGSENDSPARELARFVREQAKQAVPDMNVWIIYRRDRFLRASDHVPFLLNRYPADRFTEPNEDFRHEHQDVRVENAVQFGDLPQFLDYTYIANVARINASALAALADGPAAPSGVKVEASTLNINTQLEWQPNPEPDLAGYEIVYRDTNAPYWQHTIKVGNVTSYTVQGITNDTFRFGVPPSDRGGNEGAGTSRVPKETPSPPGAARPGCPRRLPLLPRRRLRARLATRRRRLAPCKLGEVGEELLGDARAGRPPAAMFG